MLVGRECGSKSERASALSKRADRPRVALLEMVNSKKTQARAHTSTVETLDYYP